MNPKTKPDDLATAVPSGIDRNVIGESNIHSIASTGGLTKREYFATMAAQGYLASRTLEPDDAGYNFEDMKIYPALVAHYSVEFADALIAALNKEAA